MTSELVCIGTGVWQGKVVTCSLFNIVSEHVKMQDLKLEEISSNSRYR